MWIRVSRDASVCLRCRLQITRSLLHRAPHCRRPDRPSPRTQSTAAAVVENNVEDTGEDIGENIGGDVKEPQRKHRTSKKRKNKLRWIWKPPRVAKLGVSSLGKPAEVLVLKDRDRHIPAATDDEAERSKASQPRILEALHAENLPMSSESVRQSLDQIADPYRNQSKALSGEQRVELKKKLMDGFTQEQLRSYCEIDNRPKLVTNTGTHASSSIGRPIPTGNPTPDGDALKDVTAEKGLPKLGKAGLVDHILRHKWAFTSLADEQTERYVPLPTQKLEYVLKHRQSLLKEVEEQFSVTIEVAGGNGRINIQGGLKQVTAAQDTLTSFCRDITRLRVRSASKGTDLKMVVTSSLLDYLTRTYNVMIVWASKQGEDIKGHEGSLSICYHKTQDLQNALNAERTILVAERNSLPAIKDAEPQEKVSMWVRQNFSQADLVLHPLPEHWNRLDQKTWSRWTLPQLPLGRSYIDSGSDLSARHQMVMQLTSINKQSTTISKTLKGVLDEFFMDMSLKKKYGIRRLINSDYVKEEVFAHIGKILFPHGEMTFADAFRPIGKSTKSKILRAKTLNSTLMSPDIPGLPNFLRSLAPFDEPESAIDGLKDQKHARKYRLRYVPLTSHLFSGLQLPAIEIDVLRKGKSGSVVTNRIIGAWAVLAEQSHKLLLPAFTVDLLFGRRLKRKLLITPSEDDIRPHSTAGLEEFGQQIKNSDSDTFLPFLKVDLRKYTVKYSLLQDDAGNHKDHVIQHSSDQRESIKGLTDALDPLQEPAWPASGNPSYMTENAPKNIDYMLESWNVVHSTPFRTKRLCLDHLRLEGMNADEDQQILRLARQPLLASDISQLNIELLLERAFKIAALLSDPRLLDQPNESA
ncbi:hypothetical protein GJ744_001896 [Endocarpon pusillum]|uniref:Uncharacterized protein n=1 Tax=Endocarpon pusillum TaxID=364733 RepID=A0A8H7ANG9_9EURO|nr:hypothetical protein GJ744_001896 [Endocarpon pusillum]